MVQLLLDAGSDTTATTRDGYSALHLAAKEESEEIVATLLERGASSDLKTKVRSDRFFLFYTSDFTLS